MRPLRITLVLLLTALLSAAPSPAQAPAQATIPSADLLSDAAILRTAYEQLHPGLYRYNTHAQMDAHFAALNAALSHDLSLQDAYVAFSVFAAHVRCGHTYPNFFNQPKSIASTLFESPNRVPFYFRWLNRRMVVTQDFTPTQQLPRGTEILSIDGTPAPAILTRLLTIARADGANNAKRIDSLQVTGDSNYEAFDIYFPLFFPPPSSNLRLSVRTPGHPTPRTITVEALTYQQRLAPIKSREASRQGGSDPLFDWQILPDAAYLRMPTWSLYNSKWDWKTWLNTHLDQLAPTQNLILDLRGNEGGLDVGDEILKRLPNAAAAPHLQRLVRYRTIPAGLAPYLDTWDPSFKDWGTSAVDLPKPWPTAPPVPYLALQRSGDDLPAAPVPTPATLFRGKLYVLVDSSNSSATFQFAQTIQQNHLGTLIGEPTGGSQRGINGGAFFFLRLPHSKIELDLPLIGTFPATPMPDSGLTPDILVAPTIADIAAGRDAVLNRVHALLNPQARRRRSQPRSVLEDVTYVRIAGPSPHRRSLPVATF